MRGRQLRQDNRAQGRHAEQSTYCRHRAATEGSGFRAGVCENPRERRNHLASLVWGCEFACLWRAGITWKTVEHPCQRCGSAVGDSSPFCPSCEAPQIRFSAREPSLNAVVVASEAGPFAPVRVEEKY